MNKFIIIINGMGGSGKSSFINQCKHYCELDGTDANITELSVVDVIKEIATNYGWDGSKTEKNRQFLSDLKKIFASWNNLPLKSLYENIEETFADDEMFGYSNSIIFVNSREMPDIEKIEETYSGTGVQMFRLYIQRYDITNNEAKDVIDDIKKFSADADMTIYNNGSQFDLLTEASKFTKGLLGMNRCKP